MTSLNHIVKTCLGNEIEKPQQTYMNAAATTRQMLAAKKYMLETMAETLEKQRLLIESLNDQTKLREELIVQLRCKIKDLKDINTDLEDKLSKKFEMLSVSNGDMIAKKDVEICQLNNKITQMINEVKIVQHKYEDENCIISKLHDKCKNLEEKLQNKTQAQIKMYNDNSIEELMSDRCKTMVTERDEIVNKINLKNTEEQKTQIYLVTEKDAVIEQLKEKISTTENGLNLIQQNLNVKHKYSKSTLQYHKKSKYEYECDQCEYITINSAFCGNIRYTQKLICKVTYLSYNASI